MPTTNPQRVKRRRDFLLSFLSLGFLGNAGKESTEGTFLTMSFIETSVRRIFGIGILKTSKINERFKDLPYKYYYTKQRS